MYYFKNIDMNLDLTFSWPIVRSGLKEFSVIMELTVLDTCTLSAIIVFLEIV